MLRTIEKERIRARSDEGKEFTIIVYQDMINPMDGSESFPGDQRFFISGGKELFILNQHTFQVYGSDEIFHEIL